MKALWVNLGKAQLALTCSYSRTARGQLAPVLSGKSLSTSTRCWLIPGILTFFILNVVTYCPMPGQSLVHLLTQPFCSLLLWDKVLKSLSSRRVQSFVQSRINCHVIGNSRDFPSDCLCSSSTYYISSYIISSTALSIAPARYAHVQSYRIYIVRNINNTT